MSEEEMGSILHYCHSCEVGGHFGASKTIAKVLQLGFYWATLSKDSFNFVANCDKCQRVRNISRKNEMPLIVYFDGVRLWASLGLLCF